MSELLTKSQNEGYEAFDDAFHSAKGRISRSGAARFAAPLPYLPLYFILVAMPPRRWRSALF